MVPNPFYLAGPTASGKSELAVELARRWNAEIVCADPFQLFAALPILTAQPDARARAAVPHHLYGTLPPNAAMDVARYRSLALPVLQRLVDAGRRVIVVGGSGLYLKALTHGLDPLPAPDPALRAKLEARPLEERVRELCALDPKAATVIDLRNPRRVIRALEVCLLTGRPFTEARSAWETAPPRALGLLLDPPPGELLARIAGRTSAMFAAGVVQEVAATPAVGPSLAQAIGYREIQALLAGRMDPQACRAAVLTSTARYAKRQRTWFRKQAGYARIESPDVNGAEEVLLSGGGDSDR